jgi:Fe-S cluster biogenesis protein NfuA/nitrite reductase/ring-hydroxylating ferredoxin subunit
MGEAAAGDRVARIEGLLEEIESLGDPVAAGKATDTVQALLELYGEGLGRILGRLSEADARAVAADELVGHLLVVHGLHPVDVEVRVRDALDGVRPYLGSHGGDVELLGVDDGVARVRLEGSCQGCPSSTVTLKLAIEEAILKAAPEVERVEAEGATEESPGPALLQIHNSLGAPDGADAAAAPAGEWAVAGSVSELEDAPVVREVEGEPVLFLRLAGTPYAYRRLCPACGSGLEDAPLDGEELPCPGCATRFDVRRAGRALDGSGLQLRPVPLLVDDAGVMKVGLEAGVA